MSSDVTRGAGSQPKSSQKSISSGSDSAKGSSYKVSQIEYVQQLIEECLKLYMDKFTCIQQIYITHPDIEPGFINLMWGRLEQQNPDFFRAYNHRLYLKRQIHLFNSLVGFQARLMQQQGCRIMANSSASHKQSASGVASPSSASSSSNFNSSNFGFMPQQQQSMVNSANFNSPTAAFVNQFSGASPNPMLARTGHPVPSQTPTGMLPPNALLPQFNQHTGSQNSAQNQQQMFNMFAQNNQNGFPSSMSPSLMTNSLLMRSSQKSEPNQSANHTPTSQSNDESHGTKKSSTTKDRNAKGLSIKTGQKSDIPSSANNNGASGSNQQSSMFNPLNFYPNNFKPNNFSGNQANFNPLMAQVGANNGSPSMNNQSMQNSMRQNPMFDPAQIRSFLEQRQTNLSSMQQQGDGNKKANTSGSNTNNNNNNNNNMMNQMMNPSFAAQTQYLQQLLQQQMPSNSQKSSNSSKQDNRGSGTFGKSGEGPNTSKNTSSSSSSRKRRSPSKNTRPQKRRRNSSPHRNEKIKNLMEQYGSPEQNKVLRSSLKQEPNIDLSQLEEKLKGKSNPAPNPDPIASPTGARNASSNHDVRSPTFGSKNTTGIGGHPFGDDDAEYDDPHNFWERPTDTQDNDDLFGDFSGQYEEDPCSDLGLFNEYLND